MKTTKQIETSKDHSKRLRLRRETVVKLDDQRLKDVVGGLLCNSCRSSCGACF
jgi:hypothetical protein